MTFSQLQPLPSLFVSCSYEAAVVPPKPTHSRHLLALFLRSGKLLADSEPRWNPLHPTFYLFHAVLRSLHLSHTNSFSPINVIIINKEGNRNKKKTIFFFCVCPPVSSIRFEEGQQLTARLAGRLMFAHDNCITKKKIGSNRKPMMQFPTICRLLRVLRPVVPTYVKQNK